MNSARPPTPIPIFISYAWQDTRSLAERVCACLRSAGYQPWLDREQGVPPGLPFDVRIEIAIQDSKVLIALLSSASVRPDSFCRRELLYAQTFGKPILPVRVNPVIPPVQIISLNWIDAFDDFDSALKKLPSAIRSLLAQDAPALRTWLPASLASAWWRAHSGLDFSEELARHSAVFCGRDWLFDRLSRWASSPSSRVLLLAGPPGIGKSAIAAQLTARLNVRAVHFCSLSNTVSCAPQTWVASVVNQLALQFTPYRIEVEALPPPNWGDVGSLFRTLVTDPLRRCENYLDVHDPWVLAVDGLDEAVAAGTPFTDVIADAVQRLPDWIRFILTARPDASLLARFQIPGVRIEYLSPDDPQHLTDLKQFVQLRLAHLPASSPPFRYQSRQDQIAAAAQGSFLIASVMLRHLEEGIGGLPDPTIGGNFAALFNRRYPTAPQYDAVRPLLACLVAAEEPLPKEVLFAVSAGLGSDGESLLASLSEILHRKEDRVSLFHHSIADWLSSHEWSGHFALDPLRGHHLLSDAGMQALSSRAAIHEYFRRHLAIHLRKAKRWRELDSLLADSRLELLVRWTERDEGDEGVLCLRGLIENLPPSSFERAAALATQLARVQSRRGAFRDAEEKYRLAHSIAVKAGNPLIRALALNGLASLRLYRGEYGEARKLFRRSRIVTSFLGHRRSAERLASTLGLATVELAIGKERKAWRLARQAEAVSQRKGEVPYWIAAQRILAALERSSLSFDNAETRLAWAETIARSCDLKAERAALLLARAWTSYSRTAIEAAEIDGVVPLFQASFEEAQHACYAAVGLAAELGRTWCLLVSGNTEGAAAALRRVWSALPEAPPRDIGAAARVARANLAYITRRQEAEAEYRAALDYSRRGQQRSREIDCLLGLGNIAWWEGRKEEAESIWTSGILLAQGRGFERRQLAELSVLRARENREAVPL